MPPGTVVHERGSWGRQREHKGSLSDFYACGLFEVVLVIWDPGAFGLWDLSIYPASSPLVCAEQNWMQRSGESHQEDGVGGS